MPAKISTDASITLRFGREIESMISQDTMARILDEFSDKYIIALEQKGDETTQHYQIAAILREPTDISDGFKRKLANRIKDSMDFEWSEHNDKVALKCKYHPEIKGQFGYCMKQDADPLTKGCDAAWLEEANELYNLRLSQSKKKIPVSKSNFLSLIREMYDELWKQIGGDSERLHKFGTMDNCKKFNILEKMLIIRGYDCSCINPTQRQLIIRNFDEYIVGYVESSMGDMDVFDSEI